MATGGVSLHLRAAEVQKGTPETPSSAASVAGSYICHDDAELPLLAPVKAIVEQKQPCAAYIKTADGRRLCIGGPGATPEVAGFVQVLQEGQTYKFPDAFLEHRKGRTEKR